jgi:glucose/arabinose dehydrogenase
MAERPSSLLNTARLAALAASLLLVACGGGSGGDTPAPPPPPVGNPPIAQIDSPAEGATFAAGDTLTFTGSATDPEDGVLPASSLSWWADLHHDTHTHPLQLATAGASGTVTIPVRGETSSNIWYRFHLKATDSNGRTTEVTRDVQPRKAQVTLATVPAGLALTIDGQPVTGPNTFTGVVGIERDIGAATQVLNGRNYAFATWSDGGSATHTISTPAADTTYTATFTDQGPATNQPPTVTLAAAATGVVGTAMTLTATAADPDGTVAKVEFLDGATLLNTDTATPFAFSWTPATAGAHSLTARATDNTGAATTSTAVTVTVTTPQGPDTQAPTIAITAPVNLATNLTGTLNITTTATDNVGVAGVEFQFDGAALGTEDTTAPFSASVVTANHASGQHVIRARARDAAGNRSDWTSATVKFGGTVALPAGFTKNESWVDGLTSATAFAQAADGRLFVAEQGGTLRVVKNGVLQVQPFVSLANVDSQGERGLIGVALHPNFATNGWVYVYHTTTQNGTHNRITRYTAAGDVAAPGNPTVIFNLPALSAATNHNGGAMHFGNDGKLYVGVGDNARGSPAQDKTMLWGKLLRLNDDGTIPTDNPFFAASNGADFGAVWAYGLRNPFTFAVRPTDGRIHINDVGEVTWEEVNVGTAGANYGWPTSEGNERIATGMTAPLFTYKHSATNPEGNGPGGFFVGQCIAGGTFYPAGGNFPAMYRGSYFFADYVAHTVGRIDLANGNAAYAFAKLDGDPVDMLTGADGALYILRRGGIVKISAN